MPPDLPRVLKSLFGFVGRIPAFVLAALQELVRPRPVHRKADEERKKHLAAVLNLIAGAFFAVGVLAPWTSGQPLNWRAIAFAILAALLVGAARRHLRYIPEETSTEDDGGRL